MLSRYGSQRISWKPRPESSRAVPGTRQIMSLVMGCGEAGKRVRRANAYHTGPTAEPTNVPPALGVSLGACSVTGAALGR